MKIKVPAKWVIAGEHRILDGGSAIALPHPEFSLTVVDEFEDRDSSTSLLDPGVWKKICETAAKNGLDPEFFHPIVKIYTHSTIPVGGGLGSSAALCVGILRLFAQKNPTVAINSQQLWNLGRELEGIFHGQSSGMDIAAVMSETPILFSRKNGEAVVQPLSCDLSAFHFRFHDTGLRGKTSDCIQRVRDTGNVAAPRKMKEAVALARKALEQSSHSNPETARNLMAQSFEHSWEAYLLWDLLPSPVRAQAQALKDQGALAVRLTGAGMGGFLVSIWPDERF